MNDEENQGNRPEDGPPEPGTHGGDGPGVSTGDVETPGAATTPNEKDSDDEDEGGD
jgi:hypothetical protein